MSGGYDISPRKGYIALESEGAPTLFRNIRIRELPSSGALDPKHVSTAYDGHKARYDGASLDGWLLPADRAVTWKATDWTMTHESEPSGRPMPLLSADSYGDVEIVTDWRWVDEAEPVAGETPTALRDVLPSGARAVVVAQAGPGVQPAGKWNRVVQRIVGSRLTMTVNGTTVIDNAVQEGLPARGRLALVPVGRRVEFANVFVKPLP